MKVEQLDDKKTQKKVIKAILKLLPLNGNAMLLPDCNFIITPLVVSRKYVSVLIRAD
jgi:hypothetical protein